jgi:hypothetical protein
MLAQLTAVTANFSMCHPKKPLKTTDFMPSQWVKQPKKRKPSQKKIARALNVIFGVTHKEQNG